jgi:hypothetical protein
VSEQGQQFLELYRVARVEPQSRFYEKRRRTYQSAHQQLLLTSSIVFGGSAAIGLIAGLDVPGKLVWAILATILPAITTMFAAYEGLYAFDRVGKLYQDAAATLSLVDTPTLSAAADERELLAQYVADVERVFATEQGQWGQLAVETQGEPSHR